MERCADRQHLGALGAALVGQFRGALDGGRVAGDHDLLRRIDVGGLADFALRGVVADGGDLVEVHAEDCGHRADADRHRFLHILAAIANRADGVGKAERSGSDVRGIFAEAVSGDVGRLRNPRFRARAAPRPKR